VRIVVIWHFEIMYGLLRTGSSDLHYYHHYEGRRNLFVFHIGSQNICQSYLAVNRKSVLIIYRILCCAEVHFRNLLLHPEALRERC
jgi:hypothetical protein